MDRGSQSVERTRTPRLKNSMTVAECYIKGDLGPTLTIREKRRLNPLMSGFSGSVSNTGGQKKLGSKVDWRKELGSKNHSQRNSNSRCVPGGTDKETGSVSTTLTPAKELKVVPGKTRWKRASLFRYVRTVTNLCLHTRAKDVGRTEEGGDPRSPADKAPLLRAFGQLI